MLKIKNRLLIGLMSLAMACTAVFGAVALVPAPEFDQAITANAEAISGTNITYTISGGKLTLEGSGALPDYNRVNPSPWYEDRENITSIVLSSGITKIGAQAFINMKNLTSFEFSGTDYKLTTIGVAAFEYSAITSIYIPSTVETIDQEAFYGCSSLATVDNLASCTKLATIGKYAFYGTKLSSVVIPASVTTLGYGAFSTCKSLQTVDNQCTANIPDQCFKDDSALTSFVIPEGVTSIGASAFYQSGLTSVTIPKSVTTVGNGAFGYCASIKSVVIMGNPQLDNNAFMAVGKTGVTTANGGTTLKYTAEFEGTGWEANNRRWYGGFFSELIKPTIKYTAVSPLPNFYFGEATTATKIGSYTTENFDGDATVVSGWYSNADGTTSHTGLAPTIQLKTDEKSVYVGTAQNTPVGTYYLKLTAKNGDQEATHVVAVTVEKKTWTETSGTAEKMLNVMSDSTTTAVIPVPEGTTNDKLTIDLGTNASKVSGTLSTTTDNKPLLTIKATNLSATGSDASITVKVKVAETDKYKAYDYTLTIGLQYNAKYDMMLGDSAEYNSPDVLTLIANTNKLGSYKFAGFYTAQVGGDLVWDKTGFKGTYTADNIKGKTFYAHYQNTAGKLVLNEAFYLTNNGAGYNSTNFSSTSPTKTLNATDLALYGIKVEKDGEEYNVEFDNVTIYQAPVYVKTRVLLTLKGENLIYDEGEYYPITGTASSASDNSVMISIAGGDGRLCLDHKTTNHGLIRGIYKNRFVTFNTAPTVLMEENNKLTFIPESVWTNDTNGWFVNTAKNCVYVTLGSVYFDNNGEGGVSFDMPETAPELDEYEFAGWYTQSFGGVLVHNGKEYANDYTEDTKGLFYAQFKNTATNKLVVVNKLKYVEEPNGSICDGLEDSVYGALMLINMNYAPTLANYGLGFNNDGLVLDGATLVNGFETGTYLHFELKNTSYIYNNEYNGNAISVTESVNLKFSGTGSLHVIQSSNNLAIKTPSMGLYDSEGLIFFKILENGNKEFVKQITEDDSDIPQNASLFLTFLPVFTDSNGNYAFENTTPTAPKTEWSFGGWYTQMTGGTKVITSFTSGNIYYAHWLTEDNVAVVMERLYAGSEDGVTNNAEVEFTDDDLALHGLTFTVETIDYGDGYTYSYYYLTLENAYFFHGLELNDVALVLTGSSVIEEKTEDDYALRVSNQVYMEGDGEVRLMATGEVGNGFDVHVSEGYFISAFYYDEEESKWVYSDLMYSYFNDAFNYSDVIVKFTTAYDGINGENATIDDTTPSFNEIEEGYTFEGWYSERVGGVKTSENFVDGKIYYAHYVNAEGVQLFPDDMFVTADGVMTRDEYASYADGEDYAALSEEELALYGITFGEFEGATAKLTFTNSAFFGNVYFTAVSDEEEGKYVVEINGEVNVRLAYLMPIRAMSLADTNFLWGVDGDLTIVCGANGGTLNFFVENNEYSDYDTAIYANDLKMSGEKLTVNVDNYIDEHVDVRYMPMPKYEYAFIAEKSINVDAVVNVKNDTNGIFVEGVDVEEFFICNMNVGKNGVLTMEYDNVGITSYVAVINGTVNLTSTRTSEYPRSTVALDINDYLYVNGGVINIDGENGFRSEIVEFNEAEFNFTGFMDPIDEVFFGEAMSVNSDLLIKDSKINIEQASYGISMAHPNRIIDEGEVKIEDSEITMKNTHEWQLGYAAIESYKDLTIEGCTIKIEGFENAFDLHDAEMSDSTVTIEKCKRGIEADNFTAKDSEIDIKTDSYGLRVYEELTLTDCTTKAIIERRNVPKMASYAINAEKITVQGGMLVATNVYCGAFVAGNEEVHAKFVGAIGYDGDDNDTELDEYTGAIEDICKVTGKEGEPFTLRFKTKYDFDETFKPVANGYAVAGKNYTVVDPTIDKVSEYDVTYYKNGVKLDDKPTEPGEYQVKFAIKHANVYYYGEHSYDFTIRYESMTVSNEGEQFAKVEAENGIQYGLTLKVDVEEKTPEVVTKSKEFKPFDKVFGVYDVSLLDNNNVQQQPDGTLKLFLTIPAEIAEGGFRILHVHGDEVTEMEYEIVDGYAVFTTNSLSEFVFVYEQTPLTAWIVTLAILSFLGACAIAWQTYNYLKNKKGKSVLALGATLPVFYVPGHPEAVTALAIILGVIVLANVVTYLLFTNKKTSAFLWAKLGKQIPVVEEEKTEVVEEEPVDDMYVIATEVAKAWADDNGVVLEGVNDTPAEAPVQENVEQEGGLSLRESFLVAASLAGQEEIDKQFVVNYFQETFAEEVLCNHRENYTKTGLPLADTHYVLKRVVDGNTVAKKSCFIYVYEENGKTLFLMKAPASYMGNVAKDHSYVTRSAFPKTRDGAAWWSVPVDSSWKTEEVCKLLSDVKNLNEDENYVPCDNVAVVEEAVQEVAVSQTEDWIEEHRAYLQENDLGVEEDENGEYVIGVFFKHRKHKLYWFKYEDVDFERGEIAQYLAIEGDMRKVVVAIPKIRKDMSANEHELKSLLKK